MARATGFCRKVALALPRGAPSLDLEFDEREPFGVDPLAADNTVDILGKLPCLCLHILSLGTIFYVQIWVLVQVDGSMAPRKDSSSVGDLREG